MTAIEDARAARSHIADRLAGSRLGRSLTREMDADMVALKEAGTALDALIANNEHLTADRDLWKRRCAEETIAWVEATDRADAAERQTAQPANDERRQGPITDAQVERAAHRYWLESTRDAEGDAPDFDWEPDERDQFMWAARIVLEAARAEQ